MSRTLNPIIVVGIVGFSSWILSTSPTTISLEEEGDEKTFNSLPVKSNKNNQKENAESSSQNSKSPPSKPALANNATSPRLRGSSSLRR